MEVKREAKRIWDRELWSWKPPWNVFNNNVDVVATVEQCLSRTNKKNRVRALSVPTGLPTSLHGLWPHHSGTLCDVWNCGQIDSMFTSTRTKFKLNVLFIDIWPQHLSNIQNYMYRFNEQWMTSRVMNEDTGAPCWMVLHYSHSHVVSLHNIGTTQMTSCPAVMMMNTLDWWNKSGSC
jgi:hypothetical protein